jgi:predicted O-methyltransferase YrrM
MKTLQKRIYGFGHDALHTTVRRLARRLNYDLLWKSYYSGVPRLDDLPDDFWLRESGLGGVDLTADSSFRFLEDDLADLLREYDPPLHHDGTAGDFHLLNGGYQSVDAEVLYAMVRRVRPQRVLELGSGFSSLVIADALNANDPGSGRGHHTAVDPFPRPQQLGYRTDSEIDLRRVSAADLPVSDFTALEPNDILFIDTTHTVKVGSEVVTIFLERLPILKPGVLVHVHDVYLPWDYPRELVEGLDYHWAEQYLLQAFLAFNSAFEPVVANHLACRTDPARMRSLVPSFADASAHGTGFWFRRAR